MAAFRIPIHRNLWLISLLLSSPLSMVSAPISKTSMPESMVSSNVNPGEANAENYRKASALLGLNVRNLQEKKLGDVRDVVVEFASGRIVYVVMAPVSEQSESGSDGELSRRLRRALMREDSLSFLTRNIKIITVNGEVTLRGPVKGQAGLDTILARAHEVAGASRVNNRLEMKKSAAPPQPGSGL